tara:strand:+ start:10042 stop:11301 length:1260 start_codon:yes stop_codon:yes gene_type:complete
MSFKSIKEQINPILFGSFAAFILFPQKIEVLLIALWFISQFIYNKSLIIANYKVNLKWLIPACLFFFVYLLALLFETPTKSTLHAVERKISLLAIPLGFYIIKEPLSEKIKRITINSFIASVSIYSIYVFARVAHFSYVNWHLVTNEGFNYALRSNAEKFGGVHSTYYALFALLAAFFLIEPLFTNRKKWNLKRAIFPISTALFLFFNCILLETRAPLLAFIFASSAVLFLKNKKVGTIFFASCVIAMGVLFVTVPKLGNRFTEAINSELLTKKETDFNSSNIRRTIHYCSVSIMKENWIIGVGMNHYEQSYLDCYGNFTNEDLLKFSFNSHNQYFDAIINHGIIGLLAFLILVLFPMHQKFFYQNHKYLFFKLFFIICFVTENILSRQYGVLLFAFFNTYFLHNYYFDLRESRKNIIL